MLPENPKCKDNKDGILMMVLKKMKGTLLKKLERGRDQGGNKRKRFRKKNMLEFAAKYNQEF